ncbi:MAG: preprotein translocase subunit SecG [Brevundimonas sp.]|uniref:preprotein translocase subunit SecG n=1 Tax=Brevundimonas sp. TaxID=1871086 RepID=UPI00273589D6|nr:preprotein translocase subunit SecG [Brevundimonas sp.]MDP3406573.1 preprotein translocase subunit SecG [Brevundimonas sp.]
MLQTILLVVMILISIAMIGIVLLQKSEGGALGMGGGPSGFMTARGAGNLLTVTTWWLGGAFFACAIGLTIVGNIERASRSVVDADAVGSIALDTAPAGAAPATAEPVAPAAPAAPSLDDLEASLPTAGAPAPAPAQ